MEANNKVMNGLKRDQRKGVSFYKLGGGREDEVTVLLLPLRRSLRCLSTHRKKGLDVPEAGFVDRRLGVPILLPFVSGK